MNPQTTIPFPGERLKEIGMQMAVDNADSKVESWSQHCYDLLKQYLKINRGEFFAEFFRQWTEDKLPLGEGVSKRAFGGVMSRAAKDGLIKKVGTGKVTNYKAHACYATIWKAI